MTSAGRARGGGEGSGSERSAKLACRCPPSGSFWMPFASPVGRIVGEHGDVRPHFFEVVPLTYHRCAIRGADA